ncbi:MAG: M48 family metalloprotease [Bilophila sp.]
MDKLVKTFPPQPFPFTANVLLHNSMNAFAVPGGYVFVHTGLIMQLEHESELAGVLAHELAHVTQRHIASRMERARPVTAARTSWARSRRPARRRAGHRRDDGREHGRRAGRHAQLQPHG